MPERLAQALWECDGGRLYRLCGMGCSCATANKFAAERALFLASLVCVRVRVCVCIVLKNLFFQEEFFSTCLQPVALRLIAPSTIGDFGNGLSAIISKIQHQSQLQKQHSKVHFLILASALIAQLARAFG